MAGSILRLDIDTLATTVHTAVGYAIRRFKLLDVSDLLHLVVIRQPVRGGASLKAAGQRVLAPLTDCWNTALIRNQRPHWAGQLPRATAFKLGRASEKRVQGVQLRLKKGRYSAQYSLSSTRNKPSIYS